MILFLKLRSCLSDLNCVFFIQSPTRKCNIKMQHSQSILLQFILQIFTILPSHQKVPDIEYQVLVT